MFHPFLVSVFCFLYFLFFESPIHALEFLSVYFLELSLSIDNLFVFLLIFNKLSIPLSLQKRVLNYGIMSAVILRCAMIFCGFSLVKNFEWILSFFGVLLCFMGYKMFEKKDQKIPCFSLLKKYIPLAEQQEDHFFVKINQKTYITPLFFALLLVESADIIFALDSIPVAFGVSKNPFIIICANFCSILGLRNLYYKISSLIQKIQFLHYGLGVLLIFIGVKMIFHIEISIFVNFMIIMLSIGIPFLIRNFKR